MKHNHICPLTLQPMLDFHDTRDYFSYSVNYNDETLHFSFCNNCFRNIDFVSNKTKILGLYLNNKLDWHTIVHWNSEKFSNARKDQINLKQVLETATFPNLPDEKMNNLLLELSKHQNYDGERLNLLNFIPYNYAKLYFKNEDELKTYLYALQAKGYLNTILEPSPGTLGATITLDGLNYLIDLDRVKQDSNTCFIAMAFDSSLDNNKYAIIQAVEEAGYRPIIISDEHVKSDKTIVDSIISEIRKCKFCIADFTFH
jgi:hypothetical protein